MKRAFILFFVSYLLLNTIGYTVYAHFCGGELMQTSVFLKESCCGEEEDDGCCENEVKEVRLADNYVKENFRIQVQLLPLCDFSFSEKHILSFNNSSTLAFDTRNAHPPPDKPASLFVLYQVFRI